MPSLFALALSAAAGSQPFALGIISGVKGSTPQKRGAKALFFPDGRIAGTLGGGCLEAEVRKRALNALKDGRPASFDLLLDHDFGWDDGLICGGKVKGLILPNPRASHDFWYSLSAREQTLTWGVSDDFQLDFINPAASTSWLYRETVTPPCPLWIAGSGHIARAVAPLAQRLDFEVTIFDDRPALAHSRYFPDGAILRVDYWENLLQEKLPERPAFGLIVTRGHQHDALVLRHWVHLPFVFLGMIGSRRKRQVIYSRFIEEGIAGAEQLAQVACPVGLDIQAVSVEEIALSIMAQYVQKRAALHLPSSSPRPAIPAS